MTQINLPPLPPHLINFDPETGEIPGTAVTQRHLSHLQNVFADEAAYQQALAADDPVIYRVYSVEPGTGDGDLQYGIGVLMPGKIGDEYYMTKGHYHEWRDAAEVYIGLRGEGMMLLEDEATGDTRLVSFCANQIVYVPGHTAHRTLNIGDEPLVYIGVYPAKAGHDYGAIADRNFLHIVVERDGVPTLIERA
jgi:glucose-6-phosphate isomerase